MHQARALIAVALAACGGGAAQAPAPEVPAEAEALARVAYRFDWSPPCQVRATETLTTPELAEEISSSFRIVATPTSDGTINVVMDEMRIRAIGGRPLTGDEQASVATVVSQLMSGGEAGFTVTTRGDAIALGGLEMAAALLRRQHGDTEVVARVVDGMQSPEMQAVMLRDLDKTWGTWVARWIDWSLQPGASASGEEVLDLISGDRVAIPFIAEHLGETEGRVHLRRTERRTGLAALGSQLGAALLGAEIKGEQSREEVIEQLRARFADLTLDVVQEVELEPARLRPRRTRYDARYTLDGQPGNHESQETNFDWAGAVGCD